MLPIYITIEVIKMVNSILLESVDDFIIGNNGVTRIELRTDGQGISGEYDMIYIYADNPDNPWQAMPAHNCKCWAYL